MAALHVLALLTVLIWAYLLLGRGGFWREPLRIAPARHAPRAGGHRAEAPAPTVVAVIPARDEAATIGVTVGSLLRQQAAATLHIIVIDDGSSDGTATVARDAADASGAGSRLTVLQAAPLARGWTGKLWALSQGVAAAESLGADYLLFTDADIRHEPDSLAALLAEAERERLGLVSCMVQLSADSFAERSLIPAFVFFFFLLYPPRWIASERSVSAGAAGGCVLIRSATLRAIGGIARIRHEVIDDCALARAVKGHGEPIRLELTTRARSLRRYGSFAEIGRMISRTAFSQLRHSWPLLIATLVGLAVTYLAPPLLLLSRDPVTVVLGALAWLLMSVCYLPMVRFYRLSPLWSVTLPAVAAFYAGATLYSAVQYRRGRGGLWKGRIQDA